MSDKNNLEKIGEGLENTGKGLMGCGCLLTLLVTIPLLLLLF